MAADPANDPGLLRVIIDSLAEGILVCDRKGQLIWSNPALATMSGIPAGRLRGMAVLDLILCSTLPDLPALLAEKNFRNVECRLRQEGERLLPVLRSGSTFRHPGDGQDYLVIAVTDISVLSETRERLRQLESGRHPADGQTLVGSSAAMEHIRENIAMAAGSEAAIMITGETGTGKELVAGAIHRQSRRAAGPLVRINCSALPESLLESELFGHVRGAFTGAIRDKPGRFEQAAGGTLFLDEIGEISPLIQLKLLRFLQEKQFERVGDHRTRKADVRIISATHRDLLQRVRDGLFREDLYYRLKVFPLHLPPLRERRRDIPELVRHFVERFNQSSRKSITGLTGDAALFLMDYSWPGNIRELENAIEHAFVVCQEGPIEMFHLPLEVRQYHLGKGPAPLPAAFSPPVRPGQVSGAEELQQLLERYRWNRTAVARHLGINRTTVWRMMKRYGLDRKQKPQENNR